jgi:hypothetical protein
MRFASWSLVITAFVSCTLALEREASACGGCFGESTTVVTDHRMILSIAQDQPKAEDPSSPMVTDPGSSASSSSCALSSGASSPLGLVAGAGFVAFSLARARRRKRA